MGNLDFLRSAPPLPEIAFLHSNLSLPPQVALGSLATQARYANEIGSDGMEWTLVDRLSFGEAKIQERGDMLSVIAADTAKYPNDYVPPTAREYQYDALGFDIGRDWSNDDAAISRLVRTGRVMPRQADGGKGKYARRVPSCKTSVSILAGIPTSIGDKLPIVVPPQYKDEVAGMQGMNRKFSERILEINPNLPRRNPHNTLLATARGLVDLVLEDGFYTSAMFDLAAIRNFNNSPDAAVNLACAGLLSGVRLSLNRPEAVNPADPDAALQTHRARKAFVKSAAAARVTPEGEALAAVAEQWQTSEHSTGKQKFVIFEEPRPRWGKSGRDQAAMLEHAREIVAGYVSSH